MMDRAEPGAAAPPSAIRRLRPVDLVAPALLLLFGFCLFTSSGRDDCYISFWPAETFARTGHILNYNGQAVEQSSSLLFVLVVGALHALTRISIPLLAYLCGIGFFILTIVEAGRLAARVEPGARPWAMALAASALPILYWAFSATEMTCVAFLALVFASSVADAVETRGRGPWVRVAITGVAFLLVRPEAPAVLGAALVGVLVVTAAFDRPVASRPLVRLGVVLLGVLVAAGCIFGFRHLVFHDWFPLPVRAKTQKMSLHVLAEGWTYARAWLLRTAGGASIAVLVAALVALFVTRRIEPRARMTVRVCVLLAWAQVSFVIACGGDWMEVGRFFVAALAPACVAAVAAFRGRPRALRIAVAAAVLANLVAAIQVLGGKTPSAIPIWALRTDLDGAKAMPFFDRYNWIHHRDRAFYPHFRDLAQRIMDQRNGAPISVYSGQAGMILIELEHDFGGKVRYVDAAGLSTRHYPDCPGSEKVERAAVGMVGLARRFLQAPRATAQACHFELPDLLFGRYRSKMQFDPRLESEYKMVLVQDDTELSRSPSVSRKYDGQFAMVRKDLAEQLHLELTRVGEARAKTPRPQ